MAVAVAGGGWWQLVAVAVAVDGSSCKRQLQVAVAVAVAAYFAYFVQAPNTVLAGAMPCQGWHPEALLFVLLCC